VNVRNLDALRGLLAVYVVLGHVRWLLWVGHTPWLQQAHELWAVPLVYMSAFLRFGREAVMVFFVLSGFFIHLRNAERASAEQWPPQSTGAYLARRAHRLLPPYYFALIVTLVCDTIGRSLFPTLYAARTGDALLDGTFLVSGYGWESVAPALWLQPSSHGYHFGSNGPLWSLAFEVVYYLLYPLWYAVRRRSAVVAFGLIPALCLGAAVMPQLPFVGVVLTYYPAWLAGAFLAERLQGVVSSARVFAVVTAAFVIGAVIHLTVPVLIASAVAAVLYGSAAVAGFALAPSRWWTQQLEFLGIRSYTIYVVHFPLLALFSAWWIETYGARPSHGWLALAVAPVTVWFGCVCFDICERHFLHRPVTAV
jgi:peptidoglycan/LPS O-acetylase OafA/YrhL